MFFSELSPMFQELLKQPIAFSGGFCSGLLKLKLNEEPLAGWLAKQGYNQHDNLGNNNNNRPKTISID